MSKILVVGSLGFDVIFEVHGNIKNEIPLKNGEIKNINLMFTAKNKMEYFGGTAGNIAYGLGLLKEHPMIFSLAGKDFCIDYKQHLEKNGVEVKVIEKMDEFSAVFYGISDEVKQQIGIWQPNAYGNWIEKVHLKETLTEKEIKGVEIAVFSPGTGISTRNLMRELRQNNKTATVIFDPSQVLSIFYDKKLLLECLGYSDIFIGNDTEVAQLKTLFGLEISDVLNLGLKAVIETKGENGVSVHQLEDTPSRDIQNNPDIFGKNGLLQKTNPPIKTGPANRKTLSSYIAPVKPARVLETTGAGDAFRSGLMYGLIHGKSIEDSCKIGAYMGARSVEEHGGQLYTINIKLCNI
jgi:adenosine kinase